MPTLREKERIRQAQHPQRPPGGSLFGKQSGHFCVDIHSPLDQELHAFPRRPCQYTPSAGSPRERESFLANVPAMPNSRVLHFWGLKRSQEATRQCPVEAVQYYHNVYQKSSPQTTARPQVSHFSVINQALLGGHSQAGDDRTTLEDPGTARARSRHRRAGIAGGPSSVYSARSVPAA